MTDENLAEVLPTSMASWQKSILSVVIAAYLVVVLLGPLSNPIASDDLTRPAADAVKPIHQAMFLGHGYRFFGPDPGPSHIVEYKITMGNEEATTGTFPQRDSHWPRLMYHRWFMLSETIYAETAELLSDEDYVKLMAEMNAAIDDARLRSETAVMNEVIKQRDRIKTDFEHRKDRVANLLSSLANHLLKQHDGQSIELFLRERLIPNPADTAARIRLDDARFLSEPLSLGTFQRKSTAQLEAIQ